MRIAVVALALMIAASDAAFAARGDVVEGNPASSVKVLIYEDLQCGDCARFRVLLDQKLLPKYGSRVAFVHRDVPLGKHDWARPAAIAARWVYEQDSFIATSCCSSPRRPTPIQTNSSSSRNWSA